MKNRKGGASVQRCVLSVCALLGAAFLTMSFPLSARADIKETQKKLDDAKKAASETKDAIGSNQSGRVDLTVTLDGETQSNVYQNTQGELNMRFAVEVPQENSRRTTIVKTGDEYRLVPLYIAMIISGLVFLYLALDAITDRKYGKRG